MTEQEVYSMVVGILEPYVGDKERLREIDYDTHILEDLEVNSARLVDVVLEFEDAFDIEVEDDDLERVETIGDAVGIIATHLKKAA